MSGLRSALMEALTSIVRQPTRTLLCALGTVVAVAAFTTTNGLTESASNAVSASFNELRATTVEFQGPSALSEADVARLARLRGVTRAGLVWDLYQQQPLPVAVGPSSNGPAQTQLPITAMSPSALPAIGAVLWSGRFYDTGAACTSDSRVARIRRGVAARGQLVARQPGDRCLGDRADRCWDRVQLTAGVPGAPGGDRAAIRRGLIAGDRDPRRDRQDPAGRRAADRPPGPRRARSVPARPGHRRGPAQPDDPSRPGTGVALDTVERPEPRRPRHRLPHDRGDHDHVGGAARSEIGLRRAVGYRRLEIARLIVLEAAGVGLLGGILGTSIGVLATAAIASGNHWTPVMNTSSCSPRRSWASPSACLPAATRRFVPPGSLRWQRSAPEVYLGAGRMDMSKVSKAHAGVTGFVHIGVVVEDLDETVRFLSLLGFDCAHRVHRRRRARVVDRVRAAGSIRWGTGARSSTECLGV